MPLPGTSHLSHVVVKQDRHEMSRGPAWAAATEYAAPLGPSKAQSVLGVASVALQRYPYPLLLPEVCEPSCSLQPARVRQQGIRMQSDPFVPPAWVVRSEKPWMHSDGVNYWLSRVRCGVTRCALARGVVCRPLHAQTTHTG